MEELKEKGKIWMEEGTSINPGLSFVLEGRLVVKSDNCVLHKIDKNHFVQSIEWSARKHDSKLECSQVSLEVEDAPVTLLHLDTNTVDTMMEQRPDIKLFIECLVAKDVSMKLYMMNRMVGETEAALNKNKENLKKIEYSRKSSSMDAINTGWKGLMRSYFWSENVHHARCVTGFNKCLDRPSQYQETDNNDSSNNFNTAENIGNTHHSITWPNNSTFV